MRYDANDFLSRYAQWPFIIIDLDAPPSPKFATAWLDGDQLTYSGNTFFAQSDADNFANAEVEANPGTVMVVVQMVSKHSSSVKVTSEKL